MSISHANAQQRKCIDWVQNLLVTVCTLLQTETEQ